MKKYVFVYRDNLMKAYAMPLFTNEDKEHVIAGTIRGLGAITDVDTITKIKDQSLYYLGVFDDEKGIFITEEPEKLFDCIDYLNLKLLEEKKDGK